MTRLRRNFDPSFRLEIVRMITDQGLSISHVSQTMDIRVTAVSSGCKLIQAAIEN